jgi:hypothetical protein
MRDMDISSGRWEAPEKGGGESALSLPTRPYTCYYSINPLAWVTPRASAFPLIPARPYAWGHLRPVRV